MCVTIFKVKIRNGLPVGISLFKVNNGNIRTMRETCSKLTIKTSERRQLYYSCVSIVDFKQVMPGRNSLSGSSEKNLQRANDKKPANIYLLKVSNRNTRKIWEICSKLTIKTPEQCLYC